MARLNEVPAPITDPVELLRRKYIRQNKDITRINASQAVRIHNFENEVSRLLAENLELRGQIISQDARPQRNKDMIDHVGEVRLQLEQKLREITDMVHKLDKPARPRRTSISTRVPKASARTPEERAALMEALSNQEGRLPGIPENKPYIPRHTLDQEELAAIISSPDAYSESPDIGPPPVSHLINETPVKLDFPIAEDTCPEDPTSFEPVLSVNLEQRRKRRDATGSSRRGSGFTSLEVIEPEAAPLAKPGKRKFTVCDEPDVRREARPVAASYEDDFKYTRKAVEDKKEDDVQIKAVEKPEEGAKDEGSQPAKPKVSMVKPLATSDTPILPTVVNRRALAPKMSNMDVANSPKKRSARPVSIEHEKDFIKATNKTPRVRAPASGRQRSRVEQNRVVEITTEPETPAPEQDILSAPCTAPSTTRHLTRDTPPPQNINAEGDGARPSRRARAAVSYAEPNLRDKMRRPTKELVDAIVIADGKSSRQSSVQLEEQAPTTAKVKPEPEDDDAWKSKLPTASALYSNSPLLAKTTEPTERNTRERVARRRTIDVREEDDDAQIKSGSGVELQALMAAGKRKSMEGGKDIYDFEDTDVTIEAHKSRPSATAEDALSSVSSKVSSSRRRQSALATSSGATSLGDKERLASKEMSLKRSSSTIMGGKSADGEEPRSDRLGARRRSMML